MRSLGQMLLQCCSLRVEAPYTVPNSLLKWKGKKPLGTSRYPGLDTSGLEGKVKATDSEMLAVKRKQRFAWFWENIG